MRKLIDNGIRRVIYLEDLKTDNDYQSKVRAERVQYLVDNFDKNLLEDIKVSYRNNEYYIMDGQHRVMALKTLGYNQVWARVFTGMNKVKEADYYCKINDKETIVRTQYTHQSFKAGLTAKNPKITTIVNYAEKHGFTVKPTGKSKDYYITSISTLERAYDILGEKGIESLFITLKYAWDGKKDYLNSGFISGLTVFLAKYKNDELFSFKEFYARMQDKTFMDIKRQKDYFHACCKSEGDRYARAILEVYNKGKKFMGKRLEDKISIR